MRRGILHQSGMESKDKDKFLDYLLDSPEWFQGLYFERLNTLEMKVLDLLEGEISKRDKIIALYRAMEEQAMEKMQEAQTDGMGMKVAGAQTKQRTYAEAASQVEVEAPVAPAPPLSGQLREPLMRWAAQMGSTDRTSTDKMDSMSIDSVKEPQRDKRGWGQRIQAGCPGLLFFTVCLVVDLRQVYYRMRWEHLLVSGYMGSDGCFVGGDGRGNR